MYNISGARNGTRMTVTRGGIGSGDTASGDGLGRGTRLQG